MHICFLTNEYPPSLHGGVGSFTQTLGRKLVSCGHRITSVGLYPPAQAGSESDKGVHVIRLPRTSIPRTGFLFNGLRLKKALLKIHEKNPIDIIEGPEISMALLPKSFPILRVIRMHGGHHYLSFSTGSKPKLLRKWLEKRSFSRSDAICAVSNYVAKTTKKLLGLGDRPIEIIPNPIDTEMFHPRSDIQEKNGLILFVGTLYPIKGVKQLIQAMPQIVRELPHACLWLIGRDWCYPGTDRSFTDELRQLIYADLEKHILFKGALERSLLPELIAEAQVCVYPSLIESMPVAWIEGLSVGKAVVASQTGPGPEIIEDGVSGLLCNPYEPGSIAEKVITILRNNELREELGVNAREKVLRCYSIDTLSKRNIDFYGKILKKNKKRY